MKDTKGKLFAVVYQSTLSASAPFSGWAKSISSVNAEGTIDVLPEHENFVSLIQKKIVIRDLEDREYEYVLENGLIEASENTVKIFLEF